MNPTGLRETPAEIVKADPKEIVDTTTGGPLVMEWRLKQPLFVPPLRATI